MKIKLSQTLMLTVCLLFLSSCSNTIEDRLKGSWKIVVNDTTTSYIEITDERLVFKEEIEDSPETIPYIITEREDNSFILEIDSSNTDSSELLFEGYFENKDTISLINFSDDKAQLIKIKDMEEEKKAVAEFEKQEEERKLAEKAEEDKKKKAEIKENQRIEREQNKKEYDEKIALKEKERQKLRKENQSSNNKKENETIQSGSDVDQVKNKTDNLETESLYEEYFSKAKSIDESISTEAKEIGGQHIPEGLYGNYYEEWDTLLNELWGVLDSNMSAEDFDTLTIEQLEWIEYKESDFNSKNHELASERRTAMDDLSYETKDRVYYLIESYLK